MYTLFHENMSTFFIKQIFYHIYSKFYRKVFCRFQRLAEAFFSCEYSYNQLIKKNDQKNILTKEQKHEIDIFYKKYYGKKISYMWHNCFTQYSGNFDVKYIPPDIFMKYLYSLNINIDSLNIIQDKNFLYNIAKSADVKAPKRLFYSVNNFLFDTDSNLVSKQDFYKEISNIGEVFVKPTQINCTGCAKDCRLINIKNGIDVNSQKSVKDIFEKYYTNDFIIQEKLVNHQSISRIYSKSVNTIGLNTIILNNEIKIITPGLKIGMGGNIFDYGGVSNKGLLIQIKEDGTLYDSAYCLNEQKKYFSHPDTGVIFKNLKIEFFPKVLDAAKKIQASIPWMPFCGLDFVINEKGEVVVVEIECPSCAFVQSIYGKSFFGEYTEQILSSLKNR